jgi:hypothetical protein
MRLVFSSFACLPKTPGNMFPGGGGLFGMMSQMNAMMNQMLNDPFLAGVPPPMVCRVLAGQEQLPTLLSLLKQLSRARRCSSNILSSIMRDLMWKNCIKMLNSAHPVAEDRL